MSTPRAAGRHRMPGRVGAWGFLAIAVALGALVGALFAGGGAPESPVGITGPSVAVLWAVPVVRLLLVLAVLGCAGPLLSVLVLLRADDGPLGAQGARAVRDARKGALAWTALAVVSAVVEAAALLGLPVSVLRFRFGDALALPEVQAMLVSAVLAAGAVMTVGRIRTRPRDLVAAALVILALAPPVLTAFPRNESGVLLAGFGLVFHVYAVTAWVGGLAGVVRYGRAARVDVRSMLARFNRIALISSCTVVASGLVTAVFRQGVHGGAYAVLVLVKLVIFALLVLGGWWHRRHLSETSTTFWRLVAVELFVLALAIGVSEALPLTP